MKISGDYMRKHTRYSLGSTAGIETSTGYCSGGVLNSSLGGIFFEPGSCSPHVSAGEKLFLTLDDIFSEKQCSFEAKVMRKRYDGIAFEFTRPLTDTQQRFLLNWFSMLEETT